MFGDPIKFEGLIQTSKRRGPIGCIFTNVSFRGCWSTRRSCGSHPVHDPHESHGLDVIQGGTRRHLQERRRPPGLPLEGWPSSEGRSQLLLQDRGSALISERFVCLTPTLGESRTPCLSPATQPWWEIPQGLFVQRQCSPVQGTQWGLVPICRRAEQSQDVWVATLCNSRLCLSSFLFFSGLCKPVCPVPVIRPLVQKEGHFQGPAGSCVGALFCLTPLLITGPGR